MITTQDLIDELNEEVPATRKMLERVPFDKLDFKPSPKSMPLGQMAFMVGSMPGWFVSIAKNDVLEMTTYAQPPKPANAQELVAAFDAGIVEAIAAISAVDDAAMKRTWKMTVKGAPVMELPRDVVLRQTINHLVHHRAQLGVYLKMNGVPHPAVYGASGDEK